MPPVLHLLLLLLAFLLSLVSAVWLSGPGFSWQRAISSALACFFASMITW
jgi:hypothetical protein